MALRSRRTELQGKLFYLGVHVQEAERERNGRKRVDLEGSVTSHHNAKLTTTSQQTPTSACFGLTRDQYNGSANRSRTATRRSKTANAG